jgi:spore maturation protein CgeB
LAEEFKSREIKTDIFIPNKTEHWLNRYIFRRLNKFARNLRLIPKGADVFSWSSYSYKNYLESQFEKRISWFSPDLIFCIHGQRFGEEILRDTKAFKIGWWIEPDPNKEALIHHAMPFDIYLSYDSEVVSYLNNRGIRSIYQSHVAQANQFYPIPNLDKEIDILFYGNWSPWREEVLHAAFGITQNISLYGNSWIKKSKLFSKANLKKIWKGKAINGSDLNAIINKSKIVLNAQRMKNHTTGIDTRSFDVLASGNLLLTDATHDLYRHFDDKKDLLIYNDLTHLEQYILVILSDQIDVGKIKNSGKGNVIENYTYRNLCLKILNIASRN